LLVEAVLLIVLVSVLMFRFVLSDVLFTLWLIVLLLMSVFMFRLVLSDVLADVFWLMLVIVPELIL
jgi:hypothetical protein